MESLYQIACNPDVDLQTRYDAVRTMLHLRATDPIDYVRVQAMRIKSKRHRQKKHKEVRV